ncbi:MAG: lasso peptide biosynthesis B2 protein, partial [Acidobacteriota bacterium]|nr:lasso peptide biosynthesis B2 protein [Acidobacteriota bacterium]
ARELSAHDEMAIASAMARSEAAAARHLPLKLTCLDRALTLWWLLRKRGIAAELRIGGRKKSGEFEAHAWVELGGAELGASNFDSRHFATFERPMTARGARAL